MPIPFFPVIYGSGAGGGGGPTSAAQVSYDNSLSGFSADDVQDALDEVAGVLDNQGDLIANLPASVGPTAVVVGQTGSHTVAAEDAELVALNGQLVKKINIVRNDTPASPVTITLPISDTITRAGETFCFKVADDQTGVVSFVPEEGGTIEGLAHDASVPVRASAAGSLVTIVVLRNVGDAPEMSAEGEIAGTVVKRVLHPGCGGWSPRATDGAVLGSLQGSQTELSNRGYTFSQTTDQAIDRLVPFPSDLPASASIRVSFLFNTTNTSGGDVVWKVQLRRMNLAEDWDTTAHTYSSFQKSATVAAPTTAGAHSLVSVTFSSSELDGAVGGEVVNFRIERDADTNVNALVLVPEHSILIEEV